MVQITRRAGRAGGPTATGPAVTDPYEQLEDFARQSIQRMLQSLLEEEVENLLGRTRSERRHPDSPSGSRNGYGKERRLATSIGTVRIRRPRVRGTEDPFVSRVLPLFKRRTRQVGELLPQLYLHGLSRGDFELAMRGLLGDGAPLSASSIARLKESWTAEFITWKQRSLADKDIVYLWVDGIYVKAGLEKEKAALLVVVGARADGTKEVLAVECGQRESEASWSSILRDLKSRGMHGPRLVMGDGHLGIWAALAGVYPEAGEQRCWNHRMRNILDRVGRKKQGAAKELLSKIMYAPSKRVAAAAWSVFQAWALSELYERAASLLEEDWDRMVAYYSFPQEHWLHLRTTNVIESPFASVRLRTAASRRYKRVEGATTMIWKLLMVAEQTFRKLNAPEQLIKVYAGIKYDDGRLPERLRSPTQVEQPRAA
jgi:putative transposase